jgi:carnitine-CoA ligase
MGREAVSEAGNRPLNVHLESRGLEHRSLARILESAAWERPNDVYFVFEGREHTLAEVHARADRLARGLRRIGVTAGAAVAVQMDNSPEYLDVWFALAKLGAIEVPINCAFHGALLRDQVDRSGAALAIVDDQYRDRFAELDRDAHELTVVTADPTGDGAGHLSSLYDDGERVTADHDVLDVGAVLYTSGTTGPSKGVMLSHHQEAAFGMFFAQIVDLGRDDVALNYLPHFHIAGKFISVACLLTGARMVLTRRLAISTFWDEARAEGVTVAVAVGGVCNMLASRPERADDADNPVRAVYAVPAPAELYDAFERRFGCKLVEAYGSTEAGLVLYTDLDEHRPGSCGRPNRYFDIRLVDGDGREAAEGEIQIRARVPGLMMSGYLGMPEATDAAWAGGWFHTGDRARVDEDGCFWFLDRMKDSIRRRGENVSSFEVERLVGTHPDVAEVAAVAAPAEVGEDEVMVFVVPKDGRRPEPESVFLHSAESMPYFMVPRFIEIVDELDRTPTNKVAKVQMRRRGVSAATWDAAAAGWRMTRAGAERSGTSTSARAEHPKEDR